MIKPKFLSWEPDIKEKDEFYYSYGIKNIEIKNREVRDASTYISKKYEVSDNVAEVKLEVNDRNIKKGTDYKNTNPFLTSIEYSISFQDEPLQDEWTPILPSNKALIENELLQFKEENKAKLRFKRDTNKEIILYKDGVALSDQYYSSNNSYVIINDGFFDPYAIYTVRYHANEKFRDPKIVEINPEDQRVIPFNGGTGETFENGTDENGKIKLSKTPFIDYFKINSGEEYFPIEITLTSKNDINLIDGPGSTNFSIINPYKPNEDQLAHTRDITDYRSKSEVTINPYDPTIKDGEPINPVIEYKNNVNEIQFKETFNNTVNNLDINHGDAVINVKYNYIKTNVRVKIVMRSTSKEKFCMPYVSDYNLILNTFN